MTPLLVLYLVGMALTTAAYKVVFRTNPDFKDESTTAPFWPGVLSVVFWPVVIVAVLCTWGIITLLEIGDPSD